MAIVVTNEINVPAERADAVAKKFAENSHNLDSFDGFLGFQVLRPTEPDDGRWLVVTHWADEASYQAWIESSHFAHAHPRQGERTAKRVPAPSVVRHYDVAFDCEGGN